MRKLQQLVLPFIAAAALSSTAMAAPIQLGINGDAQVGANYTDFGQYPNGAPYTPAPGYGTFEISLVNAGDFSNAGVTTGEFGNVQSLNEPPGPVTLPGPFMTFVTGGSNLELWATNIPAGAVGPYTLTDTPDGAVVSFDVDGYIYNTTTQTRVDNFSSTFTMSFTGQTVATLFANLPINTPFSATFIATPVPEPAVFGMLMAGAGVLGIRRSKRKYSAVD